MEIVPGNLSLDQLKDIHAGGVALTLQPDARLAIRRSAAVVQRAAQGSAPVYGVNTGFGKLASTRISEGDLDTLQLNLIRSHSVGVGAPLSPAVLRLMLALKAASLARVLWNDPGTGVMRHADAGYEDAIACAKKQGLNLPMIG